MIGPRRGVPAVPQTSKARSSILSARKENTERSRVSGSRSRSRCSSTRQEIEKETEKSKEKEFAWMDSDDEASASPASPPSQPREKSPEKVALEDVHTLSQMTRMAGSFEQRPELRKESVALGQPCFKGRCSLRYIIFGVGAVAAVAALKSGGAERCVVARDGTLHLHSSLILFTPLRFAPL